MVSLTALGIELELPPRIRYHNLGKVDSLPITEMEILTDHGETMRSFAIATVLGAGVQLDSDGECFGPLHDRKDPKMLDFYVGINKMLAPVKASYVQGREETNFLQRARLLGALRLQLQNDHLQGTGVLTFSNFMVRSGLGPDYADRIAAIGGVYAAMRAGHSLEEVEREVGNIHLGQKTKERILRERVIGMGAIFEETEIARADRVYRAEGYDCA